MYKTDGMVRNIRQREKCKPANKYPQQDEFIVTYLLQLLQLFSVVISLISKKVNKRKHIVLTGA